ncbi:MAG: ATPase [Acidimicrobiaceae bacterium]|nr:ATPase [Acidimicrobiaceae bacterium]
MVTRSFSHSSASIREARRFATGVLAQLPTELSETASLLVSELATNALLYGPGGFEIAVEYRPEVGSVRIGVSDPGEGELRVERPEVTEEHGRGLQLLDALSDRWGVDRVPGVPGKTVWFELMAEALAGPEGSEPDADQRSDSRADEGPPADQGPVGVRERAPSKSALPDASLEAFAGAIGPERLSCWDRRCPSVGARASSGSRRSPAGHRSWRSSRCGRGRSA